METAIQKCRLQRAQASKECRTSHLSQWARLLRENQFNYNTVFLDAASSECVCVCVCGTTCPASKSLLLRGEEVRHLFTNEQQYLHSEWWWWWLRHCAPLVFTGPMDLRRWCCCWSVHVRVLQQLIGFSSSSSSAVAVTAAAEFFRRSVLPMVRRFNQSPV